LKRFGEYDGRLKGLLVRKDDGREMMEERKWLLRNTIFGYRSIVIYYFCS
jgi:hypothetical protein